MYKPNRSLKIEKLLLHGGYEFDPATGASTVPIYQATSYRFKNTKHTVKLFGLKESGNIYSRMTNPTVNVLEKRIAFLDQGAGVLAVASGQSVITLAILNIIQAGDEIVSSHSLYGGVYSLFRYIFSRLGIKVKFVKSNDLRAFQKAITFRTKALYALKGFRLSDVAIQRLSFSSRFRNASFKDEDALRQCIGSSSIFTKAS